MALVLQICQYLGGLDKGIFFLFALSAFVKAIGPCGGPGSVGRNGKSHILSLFLDNIVSYLSDPEEELPKVSKF